MDCVIRTRDRRTPRRAALARLREPACGFPYPNYWRFAPIARRRPGSRIGMPAPNPNMAITSRVSHPRTSGNTALMIRIRPATANPIVVCCAGVFDRAGRRPSARRKALRRFTIRLPIRRPERNDVPITGTAETRPATGGAVAVAMKMIAGTSTTASPAAMAAVFVMRRWIGVRVSG